LVVIKLATTTKIWSPHAWRLKNFDYPSYGDRKFFAINRAVIENFQLPHDW
jgi:hypothetical protein